MSFGRKAYDGNVARRYPSITKWGDSFGTESKTRKYASPKRPVRNLESIDTSEAFFTEESDKDRYLITYADLITLLLGLFIILYTISHVDMAKYEKIMDAMGDVFGGRGEIVGIDGSQSPIVLNPIEKLKGEVNNLISDLNYGEFMQVEENERGVIIRIQDNILFPSGNASLNTDSKKVLFDIANILKNIPNDIRIEGNTDNIPIHTAEFPSNWHLSSARASNTVLYFIEDCGLDPQKLSIVGNADINPIAANTTPEGRSKNRRVDIVIIK